MCEFTYNKLVGWFDHVHVPIQVILRLGTTARIHYETTLLVTFWRTDLLGLFRLSLRTERPTLEDKNLRPPLLLK